MPSIRVISLGGTISSTHSAQDDGSTPTFGAAELLAGVTVPSNIAVTAQSLRLKPSPSLNFSDLWEVNSIIAKIAATGEADGVVITQGTDTIEETAFWLQLMDAAAVIPVVVTGAMRDADAASADGAANIRNALLVAVTAESAGRGVLVSFDDEIHSGLHVQKTSTFQTSAFSSAPAGAVGVIAEDTVRYFQIAPGALASLSKVSEASATEATANAAAGVVHNEQGEHAPRVAVLMAHPDEDFAIASQLESAGYQGLVIAGMGAGHVSEHAMANLAAVASTLPVVISSRVPFGPTFTSTYGYAGSEIDLQSIGCIAAGWLSPVKSRVLLAALIAGNADQGSIAAAFALFA